MLAVVEISFFHLKNVRYFNSKLGRVADANQTINWLQPYIPVTRSSFFKQINSGVIVNSHVCLLCSK